MGWLDAVEPPRTRAQPPDTPCSLGGGAVGEGSVLSKLSELVRLNKDHWVRGGSTLSNLS